MSVNTQEKAAVIEKFARAKGDTGSAEVQVALLTSRINALTPHFEAHKNDNHGRRGLLKLVNQRRQMLDYLKSTDAPRYSKLIADLGLRR